MSVDGARPHAWCRLCRVPRAACRDVRIATHGMVLTNWLVSVGVIARQDAGEFWAALTLPDCWLLEQVFSD